MPRPDFRHRLTGPQPTWRDILRIMREGGFRGRDHPERDSLYVPRAPAPTPLPRVPADGFSLTWVGHATYLVRMGGKAILTDPIFSPRLPDFSRRVVPPGLGWEDLPPLDAVVVSHSHYDHLDAGTVRRMDRAVPVFVPLGLAGFFRRRGFSQVTELDWWNSAERPGLRLTCVPVHHWSGRTPFDRNRTLWGGWVLEAAGRRVYFAGDTAYGATFAEAGKRLGPFDAALLPIGAYEPRWVMKMVHMDPEEAVQACQDLGAHRMATMHWGTFVLTREPLMEPLHRVRAAWATTGRPRSELWDLAVGETRQA